MVFFGTPVVPGMLKTRPHLQGAMELLLILEPNQLLFNRYKHIQLLTLTGVRGILFFIVCAIPKPEIQRTGGLVHGFHEVFIAP